MTDDRRTEKTVCNGLNERILMENNCSFIGNDAEKLNGTKGNRCYGDEVFE